MVYIQGLPEGVKLLLPLLIGEGLQCLCDWFVYRDPGLPSGPQALWRREIAHRMSTVRLPGRGTAVCCVGVGLSLAVVIVGTDTFPKSLFLGVASRQRGVEFLWGVFVVVLTWLCAVITRGQFRDEHDLKAEAALAILNPAGGPGYPARLDSAEASARWQRALGIGIGWVIIYLALMVALVSKAGGR